MSKWKDVDEDGDKRAGLRHSLIMRSVRALRLLVEATSHILQRRCYVSEDVMAERNYYLRIARVLKILGNNRVQNGKWKRCLSVRSVFAVLHLSECLARLS